MVLDLDCFKDTLHYIVEYQQMNENNELLKLRINDSFYSCDKLKKYSKNDIYYALCYLTDIGYIKMSYTRLKQKRLMHYIESVTMEGHNFYHGTKDPTRWQTVKDLAKSAGKSTIEFIGDAIQKCAVTATVALMSGQLK